MKVKNGLLDLVIKLLFILIVIVFLEWCEGKSWIVVDKVKLEIKIMVDFFKFWYKWLSRVIFLRVEDLFVCWWDW